MLFRSFCKSLGCYDRVLTYDQLAEVAAESPCIYIDFAGNAALRQRIHSRFAQLKYSCSIGGTHIDELAAKGAGKDLPGVRATLFFAPAQIKKRSADWGPDGLRQKLVAAWQAFIGRVTDSDAPWLLVHEHKGQAKFESVYQEVLKGSGDPRVGHVLTF